MSRKMNKRLPWALALLLMGGCCFAVREHIDQTVCDAAGRPRDLLSTDEADKAVSTSASTSTFADREKSVDTKLPAPRTLPERLTPPKELPGADAPPIKLPGVDQPKERTQAIDRLYPALPAFSPEVQAEPGPDGLPLTLTDLQKLALANSPKVRQASAHVEAARGAAIQAGLYPNPKVGFEQDTAGTTGGPGYLGGFIEQTIVTGGKLKLAVAAAAMDLLNAQIALRRAEVDLMTDVRAGYFAVLVAEQNLKVSRALARFTDEVFRIQVEQVKGAQAAAYEPMQLRVLAMQARSNLVQARNRYTAAWKQLAATLGLSAMPPTQLTGSVDMPIPLYRYEPVLAQVLSVHTDVATAENGIRKARYALRLAQLAPVPDVGVRVMVQRDFTGPPFEIAPSVAVSVPVPTWDRNQGNIIQQQGGLVHATEESHRVRNDLTGKLAEAFERYENNRIILDYYRTMILPDQVRAYQGVYLRHQQEPDKVSFGDIINAQQILATTISTYLTVLGAQWTAVVDVANLLQLDDLYQHGQQETHGLAPVPDLDQLLHLPCCHPCSPWPEAHRQPGDGHWPNAAPPARK